MSRKIAVITARGGSKRIPKKNIKEFCGKPILAYSIQAAIESQLFDEVMVSTDSKEIADIATAFSQINSNNKLIATTEKDATRLKRHPALPQEIKKHIYVIPIKVSILHNKENMFNQIISDYVRKNQTDCRIP